MYYNKLLDEQRNRVNNREIGQQLVILTAFIILQNCSSMYVSFLPSSKTYCNKFVSKGMLREMFKISSTACWRDDSL